MTRIDSLPPPTLIADQRGLQDLAARLEDEPLVAVDTEADSFFSYREKVCLVQITAGGEDFLVDPLAKLDLEALGPLFADPERVKIFHDSEFDVLILKRAYGFDFAGLFDTRVAAAALGREALGLAGVLEEEFGVQLDKTQQRSDWSRRPLSKDQIGYARLDTHFLPELCQRMRRYLEEHERVHVAESEFERLAQLDPPPREFDPDEFIRLKGARKLDLAQQAVLRELFIARDRLARERDVPPFKVLAHAALIDLAVAQPTDAAGLGRAAKVRSQAAARVAEPFLEAIRRGRESGPLEQSPRLPPKDGTGGFDEVDHELHDRLKKLRTKLSKAEGFDPSLALNRHTLLTLVREKPTDPAALESIEGLHAWQREQYGDRIVRTVLRLQSDLEDGRFVPRPKRNRRS
ncbi:MAG: HRDC domain-containing protein [Planctomycetota bacterium]